MSAHGRGAGRGCAGQGCGEASDILHGVAVCRPRLPGLLFSRPGQQPGSAVGSLAGCPTPFAARSSASATWAWATAPYLEAPPIACALCPLTRQPWVLTLARMPTAPKSCGSTIPVAERGQGSWLANASSSRRERAGQRCSALLRLHCCCPNHCPCLCVHALPVSRAPSVLALPGLRAHQCGKPP